jgi:hypothetical protein
MGHGGAVCFGTDNVDQFRKDKPQERKIQNGGNIYIYEL